LKLCGLELHQYTSHGRTISEDGWWIEELIRTIQVQRVTKFDVKGNNEFVFSEPTYYIMQEIF